MVRRHLAWFNRESGAWMGEWCGRLARPELPPAPTRDAHTQIAEAWLQAEGLRAIASGTAETENLEVDERAFAACPSGGAVCLDVTTIGWPVGDYVWSRWDEQSRWLEWGPPRYFIEVDMATLTVVANQMSHRPIRDAVDGQRVFDITGSPLAQFHGHIWGRFVWLGDRWGFEPRVNRAPWSWRHPLRSIQTWAQGLREPSQAALASAPVGLDLAVPGATVRVRA